MSPSGINVPVTFEIGESRRIDRIDFKEYLKSKCLKQMCPPNNVVN